MVESQFDGSLWYVGNKKWASKLNLTLEVPCLKSICVFRQNTVEGLKALDKSLRGHKGNLNKIFHQLKMDPDQLKSRSDEIIEWTSNCRKTVLDMQ